MFSNVQNYPWMTCIGIKDSKVTTPQVGYESWAIDLCHSKRVLHQIYHWDRFAFFCD